MKAVKKADVYEVIQVQPGAADIKAFLPNWIEAYRVGNGIALNCGEYVLDKRWLIRHGNDFIGDISDDEFRAEYHVIGDDKADAEIDQLRAENERLKTERDALVSKLDKLNGRLDLLRKEYADAVYTSLRDRYPQEPWMIEYNGTEEPPQG